MPLVETVEGNTIMINQDNVAYCYAKLDSNGILSVSDVPITRKPPKDVDPGLRPSPEEAMEVLASIKAALKRELDTNREVRVQVDEEGAQVHHNISPAGGLLEGGPRCTQGNVLGLTVLLTLIEDGHDHYNGTVIGLKVSVTIDHTYRRDLCVMLRRGVSAVTVADPPSFDEETTYMFPAWMFPEHFKE